MLKKTISYTDFDGNERSETFYFNLTKAELIEMEMNTVGGIQNMVNEIVEKNDAPAVMKFFKDILLKSYGEKSADGKYFRKSKDISEEFSQTEAYSELFMELVTDANKAAAFIKGLLPAELVKEQSAVAPLSK